MGLYLNYFRLLHLEHMRRETIQQFQLAHGGKLLDGHLSCLTQKLLDTDHSVSELIFASAVIPLDN